MAKILSTEQLSVDGDNIRLTADQGNLIINSVSGDDLTQITSTTKIGQDISSLAVRDTGFDTDVSSLAAGTSSVESMLVDVSKNGVYSLETSNLSTGAGSSVQTITLAGRAFVAKPTVTATLIGTANDPIIAVMISDVSETGTSGLYQVTFQFSDELPATGETDQATSYKLNILANVNAADQDLDTIVDSVDSDRDGDGVENSLDYDPDDSSIASFIDTLQPSCDQVALHLQPAAGETIADKSSNQHTVTTVGNAVVDNTATLFGGDTMNFDGTGDYLTVGDTSTFKFLHDGSTDYIVECWLRVADLFNNAPNPSRIISTARTTSDIGIDFFVNSNGTLGCWVVGGQSGAYKTINLESNSALQSNTWYHIVLQNTVTQELEIFINGIKQTAQSATIDPQRISTSGSTSMLLVGEIVDFGRPLKGHIQDLRISKKAVYTGNFIPPTNLHDTCVTFVEPSEPACEDVVLHVQPNWITETHKIAGASDTVVSDLFGRSCSLQGDRLAVGSVYDDDKGTNSGSVYMYELQNGTWTQTQKIAGASDTVASDFFGISCSLDGDRLVIGADRDDDNGVNSGSVYVYELQNGTWTQTQKIAGASDTVAHDEFGISCSLDGDRLVVGAHADDDNGVSSGSVYIYELQNGTWTQTQKIAGASDTAASDHFGISCSLDGNRLAVGAYADDDGGADTGSVYIFELLNGVWTQTHKFQGDDTASGDYFGSSCSLDGDTLVVGAYYDDDKGVDSGSVYVYELQNGTWTQTQKIAGASDTVAGDRFGVSCSLDGNRLVVGAFEDDDKGSASGSVYIYELSPTFGHIMDRSGNNHQIIVTGDTAVDNTATLFGGDTINFDGAGDYLTVSSSNTLAFGTSDFTIEAWIKSDGSDYFTILQNLPHGSVAQLDDWFFGVSSNTPGMISFNMHGDNAANRVKTDPGVFKFDGQFHHVAFIRTSTGCSIWYDGRQVATSDAFNTWNFNKIQDHTIGYRVTPNYSSGAIQDLRISKKAVYTGNFVPPATLHDTCTTFVELSEPSCDQVALHLQPAAGETIADKSSNQHTVTTIGNAVVDNAATLFGGDTMNFDVDGELTISSISSDFMSGTKDFTIEMWAQFEGGIVDLLVHQHPTRNRSSSSLMYRGDRSETIDGYGGPNRWFQFLVNHGQGSTSASNVWLVFMNFESPVEIQTDTWYHLALVRSNTSTWNLYVNGQPCRISPRWIDGETYGSPAGSIIEYDGSMSLFASVNSSLTGHMQDLRISKKAVYTDSFTPPTNLLANPC